MKKTPYTNPILDPYDKVIEGHKKKIAESIVSFVKNSGMTRKETIELMGISPARTSYLMNLKLETFSLEMLIKLALHCDIGIKVMIRDEQ